MILFRSHSGLFSLLDHPSFNKLLSAYRQSSFLHRRHCRSFRESRRKAASPGGGGGGRDWGESELLRLGPPGAHSGLQSILPVEPMTTNWKTVYHKGKDLEVKCTFSHHLRKVGSV